MSRRAYTFVAIGFGLVSLGAFLFMPSLSGRTPNEWIIFVGVTAMIAVIAAMRAARTP